MAVSARTARSAAARPIQIKMVRRIFKGGTGHFDWVSTRLCRQFAQTQTGALCIGHLL